MSRTRRVRWLALSARTRTRKGRRVLTPTAKVVTCSKVPAKRTSRSVVPPPASRCPSCQGVRQAWWPDSRKSGAPIVTWRAAAPAESPDAPA
jgi:hypothetical protein